MSSLGYNGRQKQCQHDIADDLVDGLIDFNDTRADALGVPMHLVRHNDEVAQWARSDGSLLAEAGPSIATATLQDRRRDEGIGCANFRFQKRGFATSPQTPFR